SHLVDTLAASPVPQSHANEHHHARVHVLTPNSFKSAAPASGTKKGGASGEKKVKAVRWESTKPKYRIPE
ncbi:hypothetical protein FRB96_009532, partial [Tulasnella sp. 330]